MDPLGQVLLPSATPRLFEHAVGGTDPSYARAEGWPRDSK